MNYTLVYLVNGHDDAGGRVELNALTDEVSIRWPGVGGQPVFQLENQILKAHGTKLGSTYVENALWGFTPFRTLVTAHPLGGCPMGENHQSGLVNHQGQVYDQQGNLHPGLYVSDAAVIPTSIGVNPFLTISAIAERRAEHLVQELGGQPVVVP
jgi:cholesterol oxidase